MSDNMDTSSKRGTDKLGEELAQDLTILEPEVIYHPMPHSDVAGGAGTRPVWRVRFELASDPSVCFGLDINDEITLGRGGSGPDFLDLGPYKAAEMGVSRRHAILRPTPSKLYVLDVGSTNGTWRNGRSIGVNTPYNIVDRDTLTFGRLQFVVRIVERPRGETGVLQKKADLADALTQMAKAITSQLELDEVLAQVLDMAVAMTSAGEAAVWLVDEQSGELFLEAQRGIEDERIKRMRLPATDDSLVGKVIRTGKPLRASREPGGEPIKVKTGYLVESLIYVPLTLGGVTFGVLAAAHREEGKQFTQRDEKILSDIGDFAAIAVQNSRLYQATDRALAVRVKELAALNELMQAVTSSLDLRRVHEVLMEQVRRHWEVEAAALWLVDEATQRMQLFSDGVGQTIARKPRTGRLGQGIVGKVARNGKALAVSDVSKHPDYNPDIDMVTNTPPHSMACVPLLVQNEPVGVLALFKKDGHFTEEDVERLGVFAGPVATAIQNARLYAQSERERATFRATANALRQPLLILDESGEVLISNEAAQQLVEEHLSQVLQGLSGGVGRTTEITIGPSTYIATTEYSPGVGTIAVMQDITYVKKLEQARNEFVYVLSHDLKSPLTSIRGWADMLVNYSLLNEQAVQFVRRIDQAAMRLLGMIEQLLDVALLSEAPRLNLQDCRMDEIVTHVVADLSGAALAKSTELTYNIQGDPYTIRADAKRLARCLMNLIDNAIKYSPEKSKVVVTLTYAPQEVILQVEDNGAGIPEEELPHLFDKYFQGEKGTGGVGLGLTMAQATAKAHGGTITAENVLPHGARFTVRLPKR
jgi:signal transduction histidine kinase